MLPFFEVAVALAATARVDHTHSEPPADGEGHDDGWDGEQDEEAEQHDRREGLSVIAKKWKRNHGFQGGRNGLMWILSSNGQGWIRIEKVLDLWGTKVMGKFQFR